MMTFDQKTEETLRNLEKTQTEFWNIARETANFLSILIKASDRKKVLEIGTSNGYSGIWLAHALKDTKGHLTTIEFWDKRQSVARENFKICGVDDVVTTKLGSAFDVMQGLYDSGETFDMVFIDANKSEYIKYFELADKMLSVGGIIAADNVLSHEEKVKPFVDKISNDERYQTQILTLPAGLLLARKNLS